MIGVIKKKYERNQANNNNRKYNEKFENGTKRMKQKPPNKLLQLRSAEIFRFLKRNCKILKLLKNLRNTMVEWNYL